MRFDVALRFKPFSHVPGTICLIPGTLWRIRAYPTSVQFLGPLAQEITYTFSHEEILDEFTVIQDLEKKEVRILGKASNRFFSTLIQCREGQLQLIEGKKEPVSIAPLFPQKESPSRPSPRLSMGVHKKQEWERIRQRKELTEVLPFWFYLGNMMPSIEKKDVRHGSLALLDECKHLLKTGQRCELEDRFHHLFLVGFGGLWNPRLCDPEHRGILSNAAHEDPETAILLLKEGAELIKDLFLEQEGDRLQLLPCLFKSFYAGRFIDLSTKEGDRIDLEWSKRLLRRVIIHPAADRTIELAWPKELRHCRVRSNTRDRGYPLKRGEPLHLQANHLLFLDRFEK
jgi:hypothetical protein